MEVKAGYKRTDAGMLPVDWEVALLGGFVRITSGASPSLFHFSGGGIPYFKVEQLSNAEKYLDATDTPYLFERGETVPGRSVIFAKRGAAIALNKVRILKQASFMDTNLMALTPQDGLECEYLYYALCHIGLWRFADTTSVPQINNKHVKPLAFPLPFLPEQRAIATALSEVDALLGGLDRLIAKERDLKEAAMQQLLTGQTRLPSFHGEWDLRSLSRDVRLISGQHVLAQYCNANSQGMPYLTGPADFPDGRICLTRFTTRPGTTCEPQDILVTVKGSGSGTIVLADASYCISRQLMAIRVNEWDVRFVFYSLLQNGVKFRAASTGLIPGLSRSDILDQSLPLPPSRAEQTAIAAVLSDMDAELAALEVRRDKTRDLKQAMMQELLTGKTRLVAAGGANA